MGQKPDSIKPKKPKLDGEPKVKLDGRAARSKTNPVKSWAGGMSESEVLAWEAVAAKVRKGVRPSTAAGALGLKPNLYNLKRKGHPVYGMLLEAWDEAAQHLLSKVEEAQSWQAAAWMLERSRPDEYAVDSAIRNQLNMMAGEAGFPVPDLMDAVRIIREAQDSGIDVHALLRQAIEAQAG